MGNHCNVLCVQINCSLHHSVAVAMLVTWRSHVIPCRASTQESIYSTILASLITSKTRLKLLVKFFSHPNAQGYLRGLAEEFGDSTNAVRIELIKLEEAGLLKSSTQGQRVVYEVNTANPFYAELVSMVSKFLGFNDLIEIVLEKIGELREAYVVGDYARGVDSGTIHLILVGEVNEETLKNLVQKVSDKINREIEAMVLRDFDSADSPESLRLF